MTRLAARQDTTHAEIRDGLRALGIPVLDTSTAGFGLPDMIPAYGGRWFFLEAKGPRGRLSVRQQDVADMAAKAGAPYHMVRTLDEALTAIGWTPNE